MIRIAAILALLIAATSAADFPIHIQHQFDGKPLLPDSLRYKNDAGETLSITRLSYLLSGFEFRDQEGKWNPAPEQQAWLDASKRRTSFKVRKAPIERATAFRFYLGPDPTTNAIDPSGLAAEHPLNPNLNGLHWSWQGGYIFLAIEGHFRASGSKEVGGFSYHFANDPNRTQITLELPETAGVIPLIFDLQQLLTPIGIAAEGTSTHSREGDPIAATIKKNLPAAWRIADRPPATPAIKEKPKPKPKYPPRSRDELFPFTFDPKFSFPKLPTDNPMTKAGIELGEKLFNEKLLSRDNSISCASCHLSTHGLSDPRQFSIGIEGQIGKRNAMPLFNLAWKESFFWDGRAATLREQVLHPIQDPLEMDQSLEATIKKLKSSEEYPTLFANAFGAPGIDTERMALALEQFLLSLTSYKSKFDLSMRGKLELNPQERRGFELFFTEYEPRRGQLGADCFHCHGGALFTNHGFANNGLDRDFSDLGLGAITKKASDAGKFSVPSLRNVSLTAPYMHDGRFKTLEEVIDHYDHGLQPSETLDPNLAKHPKQGIGLSKEDKAALVSFLKTLSKP